MKRKGKIWFFVAAGLIFFLAFSTFFGVNSRYGDIVTPIVKPASQIRFGIDIRGGVDVSFVPATEEKATQSQLEAAQAVVEQRLISLGITDYELYKDINQSRIILRFPWRQDETEFNPETAIQEISAAALLTFREGGEYDQTTGVPTGVTAETIILQGNDVANASARYGDTDGSGTPKHHILLELSPEGTTKFTEATGRISAQGGSISIWMDDTLISNPSVSSAITSSTAVITGDFTAEAAKSLADKINAGALPFALRAESYSTISPTLGSQSLRAMVIAGVVAFVLVAFFMVFNYRLPGFVASIALFGQTAATIALVSGYFAVFPSSTLTLPGIAGIILAIGMGVDANVIIAERIKEELRAGKKLDAAIKSGFERAFAPVVDGNITVLIVAAILMGAFGPTDSFFAKVLSPVFSWFGPSTAGTIYSFGYTLLCGVLLNFVFGVLAARIMLVSVSKLGFLRSTWLYGGLKPGQKAREDKSIGFVKNRKKYFAFSSLIIVVIIAASFTLGVAMDVQFRGGAIISYAYTGAPDMEKLQTAIDETLQSKVNLQTGAAGGTSTLTITLPGASTVEVEKLNQLTAALNEGFAANSFEQLQVNNVQPSIGRVFLIKCVVAVILASVLILLYIAYRFRKIGGWRGGLTAVVALVHDLIVVYGVYVVLGIPLSGNFIAALLTILGYSINDTVVIYDRVRENRSLYSKRMPFAELVNLSINQSLRRSINTTVTTLVALACVCIFAVVYGLNSIFTFAFPIMVGMVSGVYSTVCIAGPLWVGWENKRAKITEKPAPKTQDKKPAEIEKAEEKTQEVEETKKTQDFEENGEE